MRPATLSVEVYKYDINADAVTIESASVQPQPLDWEDSEIPTDESSDYPLIFKSVLLFQVVSRFANLVAVLIRHCNHLHDPSNQRELLNKVKTLDSSAIVAKAKWELTLKGQSQFEL